MASLSFFLSFVVLDSSRWLQPADRRKAPVRGFVPRSLSTIFSLPAL